MTASTAPLTPDARAHKDLPTWDLRDLYGDRHDPAIERDLQAAKAVSEDFAARYRDKLESLDGAALAEAIAEYERISEILDRLMSFAQLDFAADQSAAEAGRFYQTVQERITDISSLTLFFRLQLTRLDEAVLDRQLADPACARYAPWLRDVRVFRPHQLSDELESLLHDKHVAGRSSWVRLFDETQASLRFQVAEETLSASQVFHRLLSPQREVRRQASQAISQTLGDNIRLLALITNTLAKDKEIEDRWRKYSRPVSSRNLSNHVEDHVVDALVTAVRQSYGDLSHRYYQMKAQWLGLDKLATWDRNAPLPQAPQADIPWDQAVARVLAAYRTFSPQLAEVAQPFFDNAWIDAQPRPGKDAGAFAHPTVPSSHPYLLLNYQGTVRDVMTLAHELGHGCHQRLAAGQGLLMSDTPLTLAETASVFGEMLTFRHVLDDTQDPVQRKVMLAGKVEDMLNTVVRQIAFYEFERRVHDERRAGELSSQRLAEIWFDVQRESLGPAFEFDDGYGVFWSYIPHFIHSPFYVYAYAFGDCLVNALYGVYLDEKAAGRGADFEAKYLDLLRAGGTLHHGQLLAPFGLDASDPAFWRRGLGVITDFVDELAALG